MSRSVKSIALFPTGDVLTLDQVEEAVVEVLVAQTPAHEVIAAMKLADEAKGPNGTTQLALVEEVPTYGGHENEVDEFDELEEVDEDALESEAPLTVAERDHYPPRPR